mgnify:CR=1 FL=1
MVEDADKVSAGQVTPPVVVIEPVKEPAEQPLTRAELKELQKQFDDKIEQTKRHFQGLKDREVAAERKARLNAETRLGNVEAQNRAFQQQYLESLSPEERLAFENKELRRRLDTLEKRPSDGDQPPDEPRHITLEEAKESLRAEVEVYGVDVNDPKIDWALDDPQGQRRFYNSLAKIQKATHDETLKTTTEKVEAETRRKFEEKYKIGVVEVSGSSGKSGGLTPEQIGKMSSEERWQKREAIDKLSLGI